MSSTLEPNTVMRYWSADTLLWQLSIDHEMDLHKLTQVGLFIFFGCHFARYLVMWHWLAGFLFWQLSINVNLQRHLADVDPYVAFCL